MESNLEACTEITNFINIFGGIYPLLTILGILTAIILCVSAIAIDIIIDKWNALPEDVTNPYSGAELLYSVYIHQKSNTLYIYERNRLAYGILMLHKGDTYFIAPDKYGGKTILKDVKLVLEYSFINKLYKE